MDNSKISNLPIFKHIESSEIGESINKFRKGEKGLFSIFKLLLLGAVGYFSWVYVLPVVFQAIGQVLAIATTGIIIVALVILAPVILKGLRRFTRYVHKGVIRHDPFAELEVQKQKMQANKVKFQKAKGKIVSLKHDMEVSAEESESRAKKIQKSILSLKTKAKDLKTKLSNMVKKSGAKAKNTDTYVNDYSDYRKLVSKSDRMIHEYNQEKDFVQKYGARGLVMKKFSQKLVLVETTMDIKIDDFNATVGMLKKDYDFARKSREATKSAKDAMLFSENWELEYALDVVTTSIAEDIAITTGNLNDIDSLTSMYTIDDDELFSNLDLLADEINTGKDFVPEASDYRGPDYKLSSSDKIKSGGFDGLTENMF